MKLEELIYKRFVSCEEFSKHLAVFNDMPAVLVRNPRMKTRKGGAVIRTIRRLFTILIYRRMRKDTVQVHYRYHCFARIRQRLYRKILNQSLRAACVMSY